MTNLENKCKCIRQIEVTDPECPIHNTPSSEGKEVGNACFNGNHHNCSYTVCGCECHHIPDVSKMVHWEKDFDEKFPKASSIDVSPKGTWSLNYDTREIKDFIRTLLSQEITHAVARREEELVREVDAIESDALSVGMEKQSRQIINRIRDFINSKGNPTQD